MEYLWSMYGVSSKEERMRSEGIAKERTYNGLTTALERSCNGLATGEGRAIENGINKCNVT